MSVPISPFPAPLPHNQQERGFQTHRQIKVILPQITTRIRRLHNHLLPGDRPTRKRQLIALAAPLHLRLPRQLHSREPVRQRVADRPGRIAGAHVRAAAGIAAALGRAAVVERLVIAVARLHGALGEALAGPRARRLAAVPVARRLALTLLRGGEGGKKGGEEDEGVHAWWW